MSSQAASRAARTAVAVGALLAMGACKARGGNGPFAAEVSRYVPQIEQATGMRFKQPPRVETRSRDQIRQFLVRLLADERAKRDLEGQGAMYRRLGLIPDSLDLGKFFVDLYTEQIAGFYDPKTKVLYIPSDAKGQVVDATVSHELVHALQDQYIDLDSVLHVDGDQDRTTAAQSVFEGQATLVSMQLLGATLIPWDKRREMIRDMQGEAMPRFASAPMVVQETMLFPYLSGGEFMGRFYERNPRTSPVGRMPSSTEQIIHAEAYGETRDEPVRITLPALAPGASAVYQNNVGEFETRLFLFAHTKDASAAVRAAAGWDGDRYMIVRTPRGDGMVWVTVWDNSLEAAEFSSALEQALGKRYGGLRPGATAAGASAFTTRDRALSVWGGEIGGRPAVVYTDVPAGVSTAVLDPMKVTLAQ
ncbi:MAG: hypothetical protein WKG32_16655 [Gemmatimonadaceae bacterium]